jgi:hypothetical protein
MSALNKKPMKEQTNQKLKIKPQLNSIGKNGLPKPLKSKCFSCKKIFLIKFVISQKDYSKKNNLYQWTEREEDKSLKICSFCLKSLYYDKPLYWKTVKNLKKRNLLKSYIRTGLI